MFASGNFGHDCNNRHTLMNPDTAITIAGILAIFAGVGHGYMGDKELAQQTIEPASLKPFMRCCYQFGTVGWLVGGVLFLLTPTYFNGQERMMLVYVLIPMYLFAAVVNAWFTRLRHIGWVMLMAVVIFALIGCRHF